MFTKLVPDDLANAVSDILDESERKVPYAYKYGTDYSYGSGPVPRKPTDPPAPKEKKEPEPEYMRKAKADMIAKMEKWPLKKEDKDHPDEEEDKKMVKKMVKKDCLKTEDVESIDELSKDTLKKYKKGAQSDKDFTLRMAQNSDSEAKDRRKYHDPAAAEQWEKESEYLRKHAAKRDKGIEQADKKLAKEETRPNLSNFKLRYFGEE